MLGHGRERSSPSPSFMNDEQLTSYLKDLRSNRACRPTGARPAPPSRGGGLRRTDSDAQPSVVAEVERPGMQTANSMPAIPTRPSNAISHNRSESARTIKSPFAGRPLARPPSMLSSSESVNLQGKPPLSQRTSAMYVESGARWTEKQEAQSLRRALEDMDLQEEQKIHSAAQDEAAELVWKHRTRQTTSGSANIPYANPDMKRDYRSHLRKGSYERSHSQEVVGTAMRKTSGGSGRRQKIVDGSQIGSDLAGPATRKVSMPKSRVPSGKSYGDLAAAVKKDIDNARRRTSSGSKRILSGEKKLFMHPNDRIWEDAEPEATPPKTTSASVMDNKPSLPASISASIRKSPFMRRAQMQHDMLERSHSAPVIGHAKFNQVEIQRNSPTQSRNPMYTLNESTPAAPAEARAKRQSDRVVEEVPATGEKEIRGDDIRAATSKRRSDRSENLPLPSVVSDKPGRPIVSFQPNWKPKQIELQQVHSSSVPGGDAEPIKASTSPVSEIPGPRRGQTWPNPPNKSKEDVSKPPIPTIVFPDEPPSTASRQPVPTINLPHKQNIPSIVLPEEPYSSVPSESKIPEISVAPPSVHVTHRESGNASGVPRRPLPTPQRPAHPHHAATSPLPRSTPHVTPTIQQSGTLCAHCALPIAGRILSAAGQRFHPQCFVCNECHTNLELVAFYPEPDQQRSERIARITDRQEGRDVERPPGWTDSDMHRLEMSDGDPTLRFFCHLDYHELFSPRCKTCKTPIEGQVIVACGAEWHEGHFFCAQCGDPFDASTPFVEKDGYAWCVGCHTNRYSSKCRKCRKPVTDVVVKALGADWHSECFCCMECNGEFVDGRYFLRGDSQDPVCVKCEERRLKA